MSVKRLSIIYLYMLQIYIFSVVFFVWNRFSTITANPYISFDKNRKTFLNFQAFLKRLSALLGL